MIKAVIFDLDGTLLNTIDDLANACNFALAKLNLPTHEVEAYKYFVGNGRDMLIKRALGDNYTDGLFAHVSKYNDEYYNAHSEDCTAPYDGIMEMLKSLKKHGIKMSVVSNKPHQFCEILVPKYFDDYIDFTFGCIDGTAPKPDPHLVFKALKIMNVTEEETLYVGDSGVDMLTAKHANLTAAGVLWGFRKAPELLKNGADILFENAKDLENYTLTCDSVFSFKNMKLTTLSKNERELFDSISDKKSNDFYENYTGENLLTIKENNECVGFTTLNIDRETHFSLINLHENSFENSINLIKQYVKTLNCDTICIDIPLDAFDKYEQCGFIQIVNNRIEWDKNHLKTLKYKCFL